MPHPWWRYLFLLPWYGKDWRRSRYIPLSVPRALLLLLLVVPAWAQANSTVTAGATLDWPDFGFSTTGTLVVTGLQVISFPAIVTKTTGSDPAPDGFTVEQTTVSPSGHIAASVTAATTGALGGTRDSQAFASAEDVFWLYGTGVGDLTVTVPYHLEVGSALAPLDDGSASARVMFLIGPGSGAFFTDALSLDGAGSLSRDGIITVSRSFRNPTFGPLVVIMGETQASAFVNTPEPQGLLWLGLLGLGAVMAVGQYRSTRAEYMYEQARESTEWTGEWSAAQGRAAGTGYVDPVGLSTVVNESPPSGGAPPQVLGAAHFHELAR